MNDAAIRQDAGAPLVPERAVAERRLVEAERFLHSSLPERDRRLLRLDIAFRRGGEGRAARARERTTQGKDESEHHRAGKPRQLPASRH